MAGRVVGGVGMVAFDPEGLPDRSPWVVGMVVRSDLRSRGVGGVLMKTIEAWAAANGIAGAWVATGTAAGFYRRCGWECAQDIVRDDAQPAAVLSKRLRR